jgi:thiazole synthase ThiGH ThiG subunit
LLPAEFVAVATHDDPGQMALAVTRAMATDPGFEAAREYVINKYSWAHTFSLLDEALQLA